MKSQKKDVPRHIDRTKPVVPNDLRVPSFETLRKLKQLRAHSFPNHVIKQNNSKPNDDKFGQNDNSAGHSPHYQTPLQHVTNHSVSPQEHFVPQPETTKSSPNNEVKKRIESNHIPTASQNDFELLNIEKVRQDALAHSLQTAGATPPLRPISLGHTSNSHNEELSRNDNDGPVTHIYVGGDNGNGFDKIHPVKNSNAQNSTVVQHVTNFNARNDDDSGFENQKHKEYVAIYSETDDDEFSKTSSGGDSSSTTTSSTTSSSVSGNDVGLPGMSDTTGTTTLITNGQDNDIPSSGGSPVMMNGHLRWDDVNDTLHYKKVDKKLPEEMTPDSNNSSHDENDRLSRSNNSNKSNKWEDDSVNNSEFLQRTRVGKGQQVDEEYDAALHSTCNGNNLRWEDVNESLGFITVDKQNCRKLGPTTKCFDEISMSSSEVSTPSLRSNSQLPLEQKRELNSATNGKTCNDVAKFEARHSQDSVSADDKYSEVQLQSQQAILRWEDVDETLDYTAVDKTLHSNGDEGRRDIQTSKTSYDDDDDVVKKGLRGSVNRDSIFNMSRQSYNPKSFASPRLGTLDLSGLTFEVM